MEEDREKRRNYIRKHRAKEKERHEMNLEEKKKLMKEIESVNQQIEINIWKKSQMTQMIQGLISYDKSLLQNDKIKKIIDYTTDPAWLLYEAERSQTTKKE